MNWDAIGAVGEVLGAVLVAGTLIYLIIQVRQNSASINATTNQANISAFNQLNAILAENPNLAAILLKGTEHPEQLTDEENLSFTWIVRAYLNLYLTLYDQYRHGTCPEYLWHRHATELKTMTGTPGFQEFLQIDASFQELYDYVDSLPEGDTMQTGLRLKIKPGTG